MPILTEIIESEAQQRAAAWIRWEVFEREWNCMVASPITSGTSRAVHLLARTSSTGDPIATLSVVETTGHTALHARFGMSFPDSATVARYTQLAVLKPYRGMRIATALMKQAESLCARQYRFAYSWLLFNADRAKSCSFCSALGFQASEEVFQTDLGKMRTLLRKEKYADAALDAPRCAAVLSTFERVAS